VEARIKKGRERRRLLWLPLLGLLLGAGTWYYFAGSGKGHEEKQPVWAGVQNRKAEAEKNKTGSPGETPGTAGAEAAGHNPGSAVAEKTSLIGKNKINPAALQSNRQTGKAGWHGLVLPHAAEEKQAGKDRQLDEHSKGIPELMANRETVSQSGPPAATGSAGDSGLFRPGNQPQDEPVASQQPASVHTAPGSEEMEADQHPEAAREEKASADTASRARPEKAAAASIAKEKKKYKIEYGIVGGAGLSGISNRFGSGYFTSLAAAPAYSAPALPSDKQSVSFFSGLYLQKPLGRTTTLFTGLQYAYYSTRSSPGNQVNLPLTLSGVNNQAYYIPSYYAPSASIRYHYTNRYHFLEIPLGIEEKLGYRSRFSVDAGLALGWLVSVHALQFDPQTQIYFKEDSYFNRVQLSALGGIQYRLLQSGRYTLRAGPQVQYGLTGLLNKRSSTSKHLFSGSLRLVLTRNGK
jgi:hypothetical protein